MQRGALAAVVGGRLLLGYFVQCVAPRDARKFTSISVYKDGQLAWGAVASDPTSAAYTWMEIGVAPDGFVETVYDAALLGEITSPSYRGQLGVGVTAMSGESYGGSLNLVDRSLLAEDVVLWGGQLTTRSAVSCPD